MTWLKQLFLQINLLNENKKIHNLYLEEKRNKTDLENKVENLNLKLDLLNKSLQVIYFFNKL